ncbi:hypothetical protein HGA13_23115 [Nocardia speluncae]|uniref:Uncharacterized protein n=1 Tax=Nocardia speluncae TaxID=419477 RepID=A0A846XHX0_9NOCA|nr:hypothetical protein [Nocardia speluncae]NKY35941.1 hypothetical protein [Nocardia speluncae]
MNSHIPQRPDTLPPYPQLWARWTVTAAAFAAARDLRGPRILPLLAWFQNGHHSGAVLHSLPGGRAVLWGETVTGPAGKGTVRPFGFRWEAGRWYVADQSLAADQCAAAIPSVWATDEAVDTVVAIVGEQRRAAAVTMVCAAEFGAVTPSLIAEVFGDDDGFHTAAATSQLAMAGVLAPASARVPAELRSEPAAPEPHLVDSVPEPAYGPFGTPSLDGLMKHGLPGMGSDRGAHPVRLSDRSACLFDPGRRASALVSPWKEER